MAIHLLFFLTDDEFGEKSVSILLDSEESELVFIDHPSVEMSVSNFFTNNLSMFYLYITA